MRAVQITRFGPEVLDVVDLPDPTPGDGEQLYDVSSAGINDAGAHQVLSREVVERLARWLGLS
jgi:NADPH2:quinone reductase